MPSKGFKFSITMLGIIMLEISVLADFTPQQINTPVLAFFAYLFATFLIQLAGILMVVNGRYRTGGILQITASALHILDIVGIIGIIGGVIAYKYPAKLAATETRIPSASSNISHTP